MKVRGDKQYFEEFLNEWRSFKKAGGFRGSGLVWSEEVGKAVRFSDRSSAGKYSEMRLILLNYLIRLALMVLNSQSFKYLERFGLVNSAPNSC